MTDHQKGLCWDTLKAQLKKDARLTGVRVLWAMETMENQMRKHNTIIQKPGDRE